VKGKDLPFYFWPVVFGNSSQAMTGADQNPEYLWTSEYGDISSGDRPGGTQSVASFVSTYAPPQILYFLSDAETVRTTVDAITAEAGCRGLLGNTTIPVRAYAGARAGLPRPEQIVQYYRGSSAALAMAGYNNFGATFLPPGAANIPVATGQDGLLSCLNTTIGAALPLVHHEADDATSAGALGVQCGAATLVVIALLQVAAALGLH